MKKLTRNINAKYALSGIAIHRTSSGWWMIRSPCIENITTIVNSSAVSVIGEILGMNTRSYQSWPFIGARITRLRMPAAKGMPR